MILVGTWAIAIRLEVIAIRLEAIANIGCRPLLLNVASLLVVRFQSFPEHRMNTRYTMAASTSIRLSSAPGWGVYRYVRPFMVPLWIHIPKQAGTVRANGDTVM